MLTKAGTTLQESQVNEMTLKDASLEQDDIIQRLATDDEALDAFLFSLGCYSGETITIVSRQNDGCVVSIKDSRYKIDAQLAEAIVV